MQATRATLGAFRRRAAGGRNSESPDCTWWPPRWPYTGLLGQEPGPPPDLPLPPQRTAVTVERGYTDQRGNLLTVQRP
jgi:hypothetical protein